MEAFNFTLSKQNELLSGQNTVLYLILELLLRIQVPPRSGTVQLLNEDSSWPMCRIDELNKIQSKANQHFLTASLYSEDI